ncbi:hypothetical protein Bca4012_092232 [Brassica carinata]
MDLVLWAGKEVNQEDWSRWLRLVWKTWFIGKPVGFSGLANSLQSHNRNCITVCTQRRSWRIDIVSTFTTVTLEGSFFHCTMAHRLSRVEKGKWSADPSLPVRRPPVKIPTPNNAALIEEHKLTLICRVTNPSVQKTRALVEFFLQQWHVEGSISGKDLGPNMFQFKFETERDLQTILARAPFHFKRWMLILQRWEPVVSDFFPALIPFWITIYGILLHSWTEDTLKAIGKELGPVEDWDVEKGRVRVLINGLKPLEMRLDINLSGEIMQVELHYEHLEKHCFSCNSLSHERDDCPSNRARANLRGNKAEDLGISQERTLQRLEEDRKRKEARRTRRSPPNRSLSKIEAPSNWQRGSNQERYWGAGNNYKYDYGVRQPGGMKPHFPPGESAALLLERDYLSQRIALLLTKEEASPEEDPPLPEASGDQSLGAPEAVPLP